MSFLDEVASVIVDAGHGVINTTLFLSSKATIPDGDGPYIRIIGSGGAGADNVQNQNNPAYMHPSVMVIVTAKSYPIAYDRAMEIFVDLCSIVNEEINGTWYLRIRPINPPADVLGVEDKLNRAQCSFNVIAEKRPS